MVLILGIKSTKVKSENIFKEEQWLRSLQIKQEKNTLV